MKKILLTGSEGEVGSVLLPQLARRYEVVGFDQRPHEGPFNVVQGDLLSQADLDAAMNGVDAVIHLAALLPVPATPAKFVDLNVKATTNTLQAAVAHGVKRFVYCSTVWVTGHGDTETYQPIDEDAPCEPVCMYGQTKWLGELMTDYYARRHGLDTVVIRFCGFSAVRGYGADGTIDWSAADVPGLLLRYLGAGFKLHNPVDLGEAFARAIELPTPGSQRFIVGCQTPYTAADAEELKTNPLAVVRRYHPAAAALLEELDLSVPAVGFYYSHVKARETLGFRSQHSLDNLAQSYREWKGH